MPSLEDVPQYLATFWDIPLLSAQIFLSMIVILTVLIPTYIFTRGRSTIPILIMFFLVEAFLVSIQWLDSWIVIVTLLMAAMSVAWLGSKMGG